jgi:ribosomal protein S18 acetylase RimI-like enzyme
MPIGSRIVIRPFQDGDAQDVRRCMVSEQDALRLFDPRMPEGATMVDAYFRQTMVACDECDGVILVATIDHQVVGFLTLLKQFRRSGADDPPGSHALVLDLAVLPASEGRGVGTALLHHAELEARLSGATEMRLNALSTNQRAIDLYQRVGYVAYDVTLSKRLETD